MFLIILWGFTEKSEGVHELKVGGGDWTVFRFKGEGGLVKKRWGVLSLIIKSADSQTNIIFPENDCIIAEILKKRLSNEWF